MVDRRTGSGRGVPRGGALLAAALAAGALAAGAGACSRTPLALPRPGPDGGPGELCNDLDDDGDGLVDEGIPPQRCGVGACAVELPGCEGGRVPPCFPGAPTDEACNGADDDCDGVVDDGLPVAPVGAPTVVRDDEGRTGACSSCTWAFGPAIGPTDDGLVVTWRLGFDGLRPEPNVFARTLNAEGQPTGPVAALFDVNATRGMRLGVGDGDDALTFCGRLGSDDVAAAATLAGGGAVAVPPTALRPRGFSCGAGDPDVARVADGWLFAWTDNRSGTYEVLVDATDATLASGGGRVLLDGGGDPGVQPRLAVSGDRVLLAAGWRGTDGTSLVVFVLDAAGATLAGPTFVEVPGGGTWARTVALADDDGFLVLGADRGLWGVRVARSGALAAPPRRLGDDLHASLAGVRLPGGGFLLATDAQGPGDAAPRPRLVVVDRDGGEQARFVAGGVERWLDPALTTDGDRTWIAWPEAAGAGPNRILAQRLACADAVP